MPKYLVTGGAGFIGCNYAHRLILHGDSVTVFDNLSRRGSEANLAWLRDTHGSGAFELVVGDVRDTGLLMRSVAGSDVIVHLAGQTAVTTSVIDPRSDFEANALGTFNVLEAARLSTSPPVLIYASTNKVYGCMEDLELEERPTRYEYRSLPYGVSEAQALDFHSPYGCSKGAGDQYVRDYARIYGLRTVVLRQSCIYGPRQMGVEDQGWLAWFMIAATCDRSITIYGDGKQVRDVLYIDDLLDAYDAAVAHVDVAAGQAYNIGGGPELTMSIWSEFRPRLELLLGHELVAAFKDWRPGDQRIYVSDIRKARSHLQWQPRTSLDDGIGKLFAWVGDNERLFGA